MKKRQRKRIRKFMTKMSKRGTKCLIWVFNRPSDECFANTVGGAERAAVLLLSKVLTMPGVAAWPEDLKKMGGQFIAGISKLVSDQHEKKEENT